ncbi:MAG: DUF4837 family protein [Prolixibacteraceae bacterium]|nr:DUF4837 family protein [Prolixibacteraceae bacterium]
MRSLFLLFFTVIFFASCDDNQVYKKKITGSAGEVIVIIPKQLWDGKPGKIIRETLAQPQLALNQDEPIFNLISIPPEAFKEIFQSNRNIIQTKISPLVENPGVIFINDVWAAPQATVHVNARDNEEFEKLYNENYMKIIGYFLKAEKDRLMGIYAKNFETSVYNTLYDKYGIKLHVPPGFVVAEEYKDFIWIRHNTPKIEQSIMLYWLPYDSDSVFTANYLINKRDSVLKINVPGPTKGSYMTTERKVNLLYQVTKHNTNYAVEMRGLWKVQNDFMGGPFVMLAELDAYNKRVVIAEGYVYAPSMDKRNYVRQLEAMIYSMNFKDQDKNNKINIQLDMIADIKSDREKAAQDSAKTN